MKRVILFREDKNMSIRYKEDFKKEVVKAYMLGDRSHAEIASDYNIAKSTVSKWAKQYGEECQNTNTTTTIYERKVAFEIRRLNQKIKEQEKEIEFLKKAAAFFAKEID